MPWHVYLEIGMHGACISILLVLRTSLGVAAIRPSVFSLMLSGVGTSGMTIIPRALANATISLMSAWLQVMREFSANS
jgi:hypothetical protein